MKHRIREHRSHHGLQADDRTLLGSHSGRGGGIFGWLLLLGGIERPSRKLIVAQDGRRQTIHKPIAHLDEIVIGPRHTVAYEEKGDVRRTRG